MADDHTWPPHHDSATTTPPPKGGEFPMNPRTIRWASLVPLAALIVVLFYAWD
jgi:hypothetical protein